MCDRGSLGAILRSTHGQHAHRSQLSGAVLRLVPQFDLFGNSTNPPTVGGAWGPVPIHLIELSPPALRSLIVGLTYQLGNLASSASATIQSTIGERFPLEDARDGTERFDYGRVIGIFCGAVW